MRTRALCAWLTISLLAPLLDPGMAAAHGRFPELLDVSFHPTDSEQFLVTTSFGLLLTEDGGDTFDWVCRTALHVSVTENPTFEMMGDGSLVGAIFDGVVRSGDGGCQWVFPDPALEAFVIIHQDRHPTLPGSTFVVSSAGGRDNSVFRSDDDGLTFAATSDPVEVDPMGSSVFLFERIRLAPGDADRIYLSGAYPPTRDMARRTIVHRSPDGGASWTALPFALGAEEHNIFVLGVDPVDADRVFMHVLHSRDFPETPDRVVRSDDGGQLWQDVLTLPDATSFAISADGQTVWVGGKRRSVPSIPGFDAGMSTVEDGLHGLWRSTDGGDSFELIDPELSVTCLETRGDELWVCVDEFRDGYSLGVSTDGGDSFRQVFSLFDIRGLVPCEASDDVPSACEMEALDLARDLMLDFGGDAGDVDAGDAGAGADAGVGSGGGSGCGCRVAGAPSAPRGSLLVGLLLVLRAIRRPRARRLP